MHLKQTGAPAGAPNVAGAEFRTDHRPNYTPNPGARQIARLIAGEHLEDPLALAEPWRAFALAIQTRRNGHSAIDVFEELITLRPDADDLRSAVLAVRLGTTHPMAPDESGLDTADLSVPNLDLLAAAP